MLVTRPWVQVDIENSQGLNLASIFFIEQTYWDTISARLA